jgi:hypothetical protein
VRQEGIDLIDQHGSASGQRMVGVNSGA